MKRVLTAETAKGAEGTPGDPAIGHRLGDSPAGLDYPEGSLPRFGGRGGLERECGAPVEAMLQAGKHRPAASKPSQPKGGQALE